MKLTLILFLFLTSEFCSGQHCEFLPTGTYKAEYDTNASVVKRTNLKTRYEILNDTFYIIESGQVQRYRIIKLRQCSFQLENYSLVDTAGLTNFQKAMLKHERNFVYKINEVKDDVYNFEILLEPHVRSQHGRFIRIKDF